MHRKLWVGLSAAAVLIGLVGCSTTGIEGPSPTSSQQQGAKPDLSDVPDVVAVVNGVKLTKDDFTQLYEGQFQQMQQQSQATGEDVDQKALQKQTAEAMVDTELLVQEADARGIAPTQDELDAALKKLAAANQMESADDVLAALKKQGLTEDDVYEQLKDQVKLEQLITDESGDAEPTDDELRALYDQAVAQQKKSEGDASQIPPFDEAKPQLITQAKQQKQSETYKALAAELRKSADITINV